MKCKICGKEEDTSHWINKKEMDKNQMCFSCNFWRKLYEEDLKRPPHTVCMIDGTHYIVDSENDSSSFRGFGGAKFQIEFNDGTRIVTTNLWCQGEPDKYWRQLFPDNAHFENNLKWVDIYGTKHLVEEK